MKLGLFTDDLPDMLFEQMLELLFTHQLESKEPMM